MPNYAILCSNMYTIKVEKAFKIREEIQKRLICPGVMCMQVHFIGCVLNEVF